VLAQLIILLAAIGGSGSLTAILTWLVVRNQRSNLPADESRHLITQLEAVRLGLAEQSETNHRLVERVEFLEHLLEGQKLPRAVDEPAVPRES